MDFNLKRWRHDSKEQEEENSSELGGPPSLKLQKLVHLKNSDHDEYNSQDYNTSSALPLFVPGQPNSCTNLSAYSSSDHTSNNPTKFPRMESYFSLAQWQELELQALICRHMIAGAPVPTQLLHLVKKSLIASNPPLPFYLSHQHYYPHYLPALVQTGYWGRGAMDPEPGRCRRTDGMKWRCSRDVVTGQKYCERHVNRGRNRSRKPVETATTGESIANAAAAATTTTQGMGSNGGIPHFTLSGLSLSMDLVHLSRRPSDSITETTGPFKAHNETRTSGARTLRHFFSDWPR